MPKTKDSPPARLTLSRDQVLIAQALRERIWGTRQARHRTDRIDEVEGLAAILAERFAEADSQFDVEAFARMAAYRRLAPGAETETQPQAGA